MFSPLVCNYAKPRWLHDIGIYPLSDCLIYVCNNYIQCRKKKPSIAIFFKRNYSKMPSLPKVFTVGSQFPSKYICCPFLCTFFILFVYIWFNICYCIFLIRKSIKDLLLTRFVESNPTLDIFKGVNEIIYFTAQYILILKFLFFKFEIWLKLFWYFRYYELWNWKKSHYNNLKKKFNT